MTVVSWQIRKMSLLLVHTGPEVKFVLVVVGGWLFVRSRKSKTLVGRFLTTAAVLVGHQPEAYARGEFISWFICLL